MREREREKREAFKKYEVEVDIRLDLKDVEERLGALIKVELKGKGKEEGKEGGKKEREEDKQLQSYSQTV